MQYKKQAILELDGEQYIEYSPYDPFMREVLWGRSFGKPNLGEKEISRVLTVFERKGIFSKNMSLLLGGVGEGKYYFGLQDQGYSVYGTDSNELVIEKLRTLGASHITHAQLSQLPFSDNQFQAVWCHSSLFMHEHPVVNQVEVTELKRVLAPRGVLIIEGANGSYWESVQKAKNELSEYASLEEALWSLWKDHSLAQWQRRGEAVWLAFSFLTVNSNGLRVNHVYHFVPKQTGLPDARYYHEVVNYEPVTYRLTLLHEAGFVSYEGTSLAESDVFADYTLETPFSPQSSEASVILAKKSS